MENINFWDTNGSVGIEKMIFENKIISLLSSNEKCKIFYFQKDYLKIQDFEGLSNGVYILWNNSDQIYIGKATSFITRITDHTKNKNFWKYGAVIIKDENSNFDPTTKDYLEHFLWSYFKNKGYLMENTQDINVPPLTQFQKNKMFIIQTDVILLLKEININGKCLIKNIEIKEDSRNENTSLLELFNGDFIDFETAYIPTWQEAISNLSHEDILRFDENFRNKYFKKIGTYSSSVRYIILHGKYEFSLNFSRKAQILRIKEINKILIESSVKRNDE